MFSSKTPKAVLTPQISSSTSHSHADEHAGERCEHTTQHHQASSAY